ncbi:hypothetical protein OH768_27480 [Streptomyces sp. NBC_01622]|uniref:hypothetical protein n=1 Tax=Streptomyces sp. NBC_01622 TaxID=2975903 RepID=UPI0038662141|nr:hypothetical protein OH768_27480 [Streptomyces sp. NBC_01622]
MRWWAGVWTVAVAVVLAGCHASAGGGSVGGASESGASPTGGSPSVSAPGSSATAGDCAAGRAEVVVGPGDAVARRLCVRPGTVVSLVLRPRLDDKRWTAVRSSAPVFVLVSGWRVDPDGTARASLRCAGTRAGAAEVTASAKAPDVAGAARTAFTLHLSVVPYTTRG